MARESLDCAAETPKKRRHEKPPLFMMSEFVPDLARHEGWPRWRDTWEMLQGWTSQGRT